MTDGLLKDSLNIRVVCTFNVEESKVDSALKRKGRLYYSHHFGKLNEDEGKRVCEFYGLKYEPSDSMTLANIFNFEKENGEDEEEKAVMGFGGMINQ